MSQRPCLLISACLCGRPCRYDGKVLDFPRFKALADSGLALPVCPEELGGLPTPRLPCELYEGRAICRDGQDLSEAFRRGAQEALRLAEANGITIGILKERSPSCGTAAVYDGSFTGRLIPGQGLTAALLQEHGLRLYNESNAPCFPFS